MQQIAERLLVVSPHLDDAVFGASGLIMAHPGACVLTVFAGAPAPGTPLAEWDATCGFASPREAILRRREEDCRALGGLGANPRWLDFPDSQYRGREPPEGVADALVAVLDDARPDIVAIPAGLFHDDHHATHFAGLEALARHRGARWLLYEDALYRRIDTLLAERLARLEADGYVLRRLAEAGLDAPRKRAAVACYASQLRGLASPGRAGESDLALAERYWSITPWPARAS